VKTVSGEVVRHSLA